MLLAERAARLMNITKFRTTISDTLTTNPGDSRGDTLSHTNTLSGSPADGPEENKKLSPPTPNPLDRCGQGDRVFIVDENFIASLGHT